MVLLVLLFILFIFIGVPIIVITIAKGSSKNKNKPPNLYNPNVYQMPQPTEPPIQQYQVNYEHMNNRDYPYRKSTLLTTNERLFYQKLKSITDKYNLHIISKVRMADLVLPFDNLNRRDWQFYFNKIKSKHVDFVLCDPFNLQPKLIIELNDASHQKADRKERDLFLNNVFVKVGIPILYVMNANEIEAHICRELNLIKIESIQH